MLDSASCFGSAEIAGLPAALGPVFSLDLIFSILEEEGGMVSGWKVSYFFPEPIKVILFIFPVRTGNVAEQMHFELTLQFCTCLTVSSVSPQTSSPAPIWLLSASSLWPQTAQRPLEVARGRGTEHDSNC